MSLYISLLGPFAVSIDGQPVTDFRTDALRALLAILALERGRPQRRESLAHLLSPDRPDKEALTYLRNRLTRLRKAIGDDTADPPYLEINRKELMLYEHVQVDAADFLLLIDAIRQHSHRSLNGCPTCIEKLNTAADLYRGELLAGFSLENDVWQSWLTQRREQFKVQILDLLEMLCEVATVNGEWEEVLEYGRRQIELDRWREPAYRALMRASFALGERAEALGWYETCERILYEELGTDPDGETLALKAEIEGGERETLVNTAAASPSSTIPDNLPLQTTPFFGRKAERTKLINLLVDPDYRIVTIVGEGGVGKTRLSLEVAADVKSNFPDGVWFVPLAELAGGEERLKIAVGEALGVGEDKQLSGDQVLAILREKRLLLIFDNSETTLDDLAFIPEWLRRAPGIVILASSREPLNFEAETVVQLSGLSLGGETLAEAGSAVRLFAERGSRASSSFELTDENVGTARQICEMVGGSPLAIGLAAAWLRRRKLPQIIDSINKSLDFLTSRMRDTDPRHRSMRAVFETSWELLEPEEQAVFAALSVFPGSFAEEAAEEIAGASIFDLDILCEKSLLVQQMEEGRYVMHGLLRRFGEEKLSVSSEDAATDADPRRSLRPEGMPERPASSHSPLLTRFVDYYYHFARKNGNDYEALGPEWENFAIGIERAYGMGLWQTVLDYCQVLDEPWFRQTRFTDMRLALEMSIKASRILDQPQMYAHFLLRIGEIEVEQNQYDLAEHHLNESLMHFMHSENGVAIAKAKFYLGRIKCEQADFDDALLLLEESKKIFTEEKNLIGIAKNLNYEAMCWARKSRDFDKSEHLLKHSKELQSLKQNDSLFVETLRFLAGIYIFKEQFEDAKIELDQALKLSRQIGDLGELAATQYDLVDLHKRTGNLDIAMEMAENSLMGFKRLGSLGWEGMIKLQFGLLYQSKNQFELAESHLIESLHIFEEIENRYDVAYCYYYLAELYQQMGNESLRNNAKIMAREIGVELGDTFLQDLVA